MGLFDDILKKPTSPAGQVNPPTDPLMGSGTGATQGSGQAAGSGGTAPIIVKSETSTVFGPNSEAEAIKTQNALPSVPTVHAEEDSSSILMSSPGVSAPIAPVAPVEATILVTPMADVAPVQAPVNPSNIDFSPSIMSTPQGSVAPTPAAPAPVAATTPTQDALEIPAGPSLFDHIMREEAPAAPATPVAEIQAPASFQFGNTIPENAPAPLATPAVAASPEVSQTELTPSPDISMTPASNYATPREFIEKSLENIDVMLETIDGRHSAKMTEADGYRMEKMRFAELEKNAYAEAEIMDRERDHTLRMKSIFERELETDEANRNKKTVAHQEVTTERHVHAHKRHVHEDEEDLVAAS